MGPSLLCTETNREITFAEGLMASTRDDINNLFPLSKQALKRIPKVLKRGNPCTPGDEGIDIYSANASCHPKTGAYILDNFFIGDFYFSISRETAEMYLPEHSKLYPKPIFAEAK
jgi:hypothetical protein